jgi:hypothetical protein
LWILNHHFFNQAILSPKFTNEVIDWTNKFFNELERYWISYFLKKKLSKKIKIYWISQNGLVTT